MTGEKQTFESFTFVSVLADLPDAPIAKGVYRKVSLFHRYGEALDQLDDLRRLVNRSHVIITLLMALNAISCGLAAYWWMAAHR